MYKQMKKWLSNEKGFTLVEILVVISIIAILFVTLLPQIDFAGDKARQTGVKTDFHTMQIAAESYLRETAGKSITEKGLNSYLDKGMMVVANTGPDANGTTTGLDITKKDSWGQRYDINIHATDKAIVVTSFGKDGATGGGDDFIMATYYHKGMVTSCTDGFETNNVDSDLINKAGCGKNIIGVAKGTPGGALATPQSTLTP